MKTSAITLDQFSDFICVVIIPRDHLNSKLEQFVKFKLSWYISTNLQFELSK